MTKQQAIWLQTMIIFLWLMKPYPISVEAKASKNQVLLVIKPHPKSVASKMPRILQRASKRKAVTEANPAIRERPVKAVNEGT